jgi:hypothetical protein
MSASADLDKLFSVLHRHKDLLIAAYLNGDGFVDNTTENGKAVDELTKLGILWFTDDDGRARLSQAFLDIFNVARRDELRRNVNVDIADRLRSTEDLVSSYRVARQAGTEDEQKAIYRAIEEHVYSLRETLASTSRQLWQEINSEFGHVTTLELKMQENQRVIDRVKRLNDNLSLIDYPTLASPRFAGENPDLRRLFLLNLVAAVSEIREELVDAMHRLEGMLFSFRKQQRQARLVHAFYQRYVRDPGFRPANYTEQTQIPNIVNQVIGINLSGHADLDNDRHESTLTGLIASLRKRKAQNITSEPVERISVIDSHAMSSESLEQDPLHESIQTFYLSAEHGKAISAMGLRSLAPEACSDEIWLYAIIGRFNLMTARERGFFRLEYVEEVDPVFNGRFFIKDVRVSARKGA